MPRLRRPQDEPRAALTSDPLADGHVGLLAIQLQRDLTARELEAIGHRVVDQGLRTGQIDAQAALDDYHEQGGRKLDLDGGTNESRRADRRAWMNERLQDSRAANEPDDDSNREFNMDSHKDRVDFMTARLKGEEFVEVDAEGGNEAA